MEIIIGQGGVAHCLYGEEIDLTALGALSIRRASYVEPNRAGQWLTDLSPFSGPLLGPFSARSQALMAESAWLSEHILG